MAASSDSEDESFVEIGKPLPFIEGEGKKKPITLQDASSRAAIKDSKGRPRFHGAFTGGFSAGYFNSVGSKEGWTPSTFVSSRQQKQDATVQQPEDFMDDEDLGEHGIAPRQYATSDAFSSDLQNRKRKAEVMSSTRDTIIPASAALADLIVPERLPIGIKLLRKMGWKEGQGIGPRVKKKGKKKKEKVPAVKIYGCSLPPASDESESDPSDLDLQDVTFAPKDITPVNLTPKDNVHGLGYRGIDPRSALPGTHVSIFEPPPVRSSKGRKGIRGQAFGVGALEDDDEDIYATDSLSNYDQTMDLDDSEQFFGWTAPGARKGKGKGKQGAPAVPVSYVGKMLEGFTLSAKPLPQKKVFPPPALPRTFQPFHKFRKTAEQLAQEAIGEKPAAGGQRASQQKLNAVERGLMLDERPIATSVFDLIPKADIQKLEAVKEAAKMAASRFHSAGTTSENSENPVPDTTAAVASASSQSSAQAVGQEEAVKTVGHKEDQSPLCAAGVTVKPFRKDPAKQDRYDRYLALVKQGVPEPYKEVAGQNMTEWERQREQEEFVKAAKIFRPLSNMMASRFTRGTFIDDSERRQAGVVEPVEEKSEQAKAADMKMYGRLTRDEMEWHPHNLLCKRFNVPNPYPESDIVGVPGLKREKFSVFNFLSVPTQAAALHTNTSQDAPKAKEATSSLTRELNASKRKKGAMSIFSVLEEEEDKTPRKPLPALTFSEQPADSSAETPAQVEGEEKTDEKTSDEEDGRPVDLFRAIFKNSDSESSSASGKSDDDKSDDEDGSDKNETEDKEGSSPVAPAEVSHLKNTEQDQSYLEPSSHKTSPPTDRITPSSPPFPPPPQPATAAAPSRPRKASRWGVGSIFDVLDQPTSPKSSPPRQPREGNSENGEERLSFPASDEGSAEVDEYGPALPPPSLKDTRSETAVQHADSNWTEDGHRKHKHKHRNQDRDSSKHRHKKEKKKKSKHKKEKKKKEKKKKSKNSHREKHQKYSSGSEADTESDSDT